MNTFKMMIGRLCLFLILRTHEQRAFIISSVSLSSSFLFESYALSFALSKSELEVLIYERKSRRF